MVDCGFDAPPVGKLWKEINDMKYEKPVVEVQDFSAQEAIADSTGAPSVTGGVIVKPSNPNQ